MFVRYLPEKDTSALSKPCGIMMEMYLTKLTDYLALVYQLRPEIMLEV